MSVEVAELDEIRLVGIKVVGRQSELSHRVPLAWLELVRVQDAIPDRVGPELYYGVTPEAHHHEGGDPVYVYWVGVQVAAFGETPPGTATLVVPAQTCAAATVRGGPQEIEVTYVALGRWMEAQGRTAKLDGYAVERYDACRQTVTPPYDRFDYDVFRPLA